MESPLSRRTNPADLAGRFIPERYLAGLPPALRERRVRELTQSRDAYKMGDFSELPTDRDARKMGLVKPSNYTTEAKARGIEYRGDFHDMATRVFRFYGARPTSDDIQQFAEALRQSFAKGLAAWKSGGHRPGATAQNWAVARVNSLVVGGKTSWTADKKLFAVLPTPVRERIETMRLKKNPADDLHGRLAAYERIAAPNSGATANEKAMAARLAAGIRKKLGSHAGAFRSSSPPPRPAPPPPRPASPPPKPVGDETVRRILRAHNRKGLDLSGLDLIDLDFEGANLRGANFTRSNLTDTFLMDANLYGANLAGANLDHAHFVRANLTGANLTNANLTGAIINTANLAGADLRDANLTNAELMGTKLAGANLERANLTNTYLNNTYLAHANLNNANLTGAYLIDANLRGANLEGANFADAYLRGADLTYTYLGGANLTNADLRDVNLTSANLDGAKMSGVKWDENTKWPAGFDTTPIVSGKSHLTNPRRSALYF